MMAEERKYAFSLLDSLVDMFTPRMHSPYYSLLSQSNVVIAIPIGFSLWERKTGQKVQKLLSAIC